MYQNDDRKEYTKETFTRSEKWEVKEGDKAEETLWNIGLVYCELRMLMMGVVVLDGRGGNTPYGREKLNDAETFLYFCRISGYIERATGK